MDLHFTAAAYNLVRLRTLLTPYPMRFSFEKKSLLPLCVRANSQWLSRQASQ